MNLLLEVFGRLHPVLLHLPIGALFALGVYELRAWRKGDPPAPRFWISFAACCAAFTAASGWQLHEEPGYIENFALEWHERLGIATGIGAILCAILYSNTLRYRKMLLLTVSLVLGAGYFGGTMTHGEDFILEPIQRFVALNTSQPPPATVTYGYDIAPIFKAKCSKCHSAQKQKSELRLDTPEWILKGGEDEGPAVHAGDSDGHPILERILLDIEDEDHMPPEGKRQLTDKELALIKEWLLLGAPFGPPLAAADPAAIQKLRDNLVHVQTVSPDSNGLYIDFAATASEIDNQIVIEMLTPLIENIVELSLARAKNIDDGIMPLIAKMPRLEILSLVSTSITAASQATLDEIATVHLFDTALQPEQLEDLLAVDLITEGVIEFVSSECPVTGKIVDPKYTIVYQGKEILFCCPNCPKIFWEDPSKYLDAK
jgi:YHS domain-containing protein/uncharacterized membrane protein/mono/diheme cytochrome c family protein